MPSPCSHQGALIRLMPICGSIFGVGKNMSNIGLVLSGGFAKGAYQVGVLRALSEFINDDDRVYISAASVGCLNAYSFASNKLDIASDLWLNLNLEGVRPTFRRFARTPYIMNIIDTLVTEKDSLQYCLYATCFNVKKVKLDYINLKKVDPQKIRDYLKASVALPIFFDAVEISGCKYYDGAMIDNIPIAPLMKHKLDYVIIVYFDNDAYTFENDYFDNKLIKINFLDNKIIENTFSFNRESILRMINVGYEYSNTVFDMIFKNGTDDMDYIYKKIAVYNAMKKDRVLRITGDVVLNNINKFMKKFISRQVKGR